MNTYHQKKNQLIFNVCLGFFLLFSLPVTGKVWSLQDSSKGWNSSDLVTLYFHNSELQIQWAWEALSHYSFRGNEKVLDFGAGDGKIAALMSFMVPNGYIWGTDISSEMVHFATKMFPNRYYKNLNFLVSNNIDFNDQVFSTKFDIITSFCVFHLIPNPQKVLENLKRHMHSESKLILTFPIGGNPEYFQAAAEEMEKRGWNFPLATDGTKTMRNPTKLRQIFEQSGFDIEYFKIVDTRNPFSTKEEMIDWFEGTLTANWDIPRDGRREFFSDLADRYLMYRPQDQDNDGFVYFSLQRVDLIATLQTMESQR